MENAVQQLDKITPKIFHPKIDANSREALLEFAVSAISDIVKVKNLFFHTILKKKKYFLVFWVKIFFITQIKKNEKFSIFFKFNSFTEFLGHKNSECSFHIRTYN
jgi:hypothetical protein